jgi:hypothetical protein
MAENRCDIRQKNSPAGIISQLFQEVGNWVHLQTATADRWVSFGTTKLHNPVAVTAGPEACEMQTYAYIR